MVPAIGCDIRLSAAEIFNLQCQFTAAEFGIVPEKLCFFVIDDPSPEAVKTTLVSSGQFVASDGHMNSFRNLLLMGLVPPAPAAQNALPGSHTVVDKHPGSSF